MDFSSINWLPLWSVWPAVLFGITKRRFSPLGGVLLAKAVNNPACKIWGRALTALASLVQVIFMSMMVTAMGSMSGGATLRSGAAAGFMIWLGFIAPAYLVSKPFAGQGYKSWAIEAGNHPVNFVLFGAIFGARHWYVNSS